MRGRPGTSPSHEGVAAEVVGTAPECEPCAVRIDLGRIGVLLVVAALAFVVCGCGASGKPKHEVLKSANLLTGDLYIRVAGPSAVVDYITGRLRTGAFATYGGGVFLPPRIRHHPRQKVCSITHTISAADSPNLQPWRGRKARVDVYGDDKGTEAIFCQTLLLILARGS